MIRRAEWDAGLFQHSAWDEWRTWVKRHGFEENDTPVPGWAEADDDARTVTVLTRVFVHDPARSGVVIDQVDIPVTHQLEAPALPFPEIPYDSSSWSVSE